MITLNTGIQVTAANTPLDARTKVGTIANLTDGSITRPYVGLIVWVTSEEKAYVVTGVQGLSVTEYKPLGEDIDIDRAYNSEVNTYGYKVLKADTPLDELMTDTNTIYEVRDNFDLSVGGIVEIGELTSETTVSSFKYHKSAHSIDLSEFDEGDIIVALNGCIFVDSNNNELGSTIELPSSDSVYLAKKVSVKYTEYTLSATADCSMATTRSSDTLEDEMSYYLSDPISLCEDDIVTLGLSEVLFNSSKLQLATSSSSPYTMQSDGVVYFGNSTSAGYFSSDTKITCRRSIKSAIALEETANINDTKYESSDVLPMLTLTSKLITLFPVESSSIGTPTFVLNVPSDYVVLNELGTVIKEPDDVSGNAYTLDYTPRIAIESDVYEGSYIVCGSITIPSNCALRFNGGCIKNGVVVLNNTSFYDRTYDSFDNVVFSGTEVDNFYKDRSYNPSENSKGCIILRNNDTLQEQLTKDHIIYEVQDNFDIGGKILNSTYSLNNIENVDSTYYYFSDTIILNEGECFIKWDKDTYFYRTDQISRYAGVVDHITYEECNGSFRIGRSASSNLLQYSPIYGEIWKYVSIPSESILKFNGGVISNGIVITNNMAIDAPLVKIFNGVKLFGTITNPQFEVVWSGIVDYHFTKLYEGNDVELVDCSEIVHDTLFGLKSILHFGDGQFFFKELHVTWNHLHILGNSNKFEGRTFFIPYYGVNENDVTTQRYIIKVGGKKNVFNDDDDGNITAITSTNIIGITFASTVSSVLGNGGVVYTRHMRDMDDVDNEPGYHSGYLCLDNCDNGNIAIRGSSTRDVPLISIGRNYEFNYDYIIDYGHLGKSDCPVINFAGHNNNIISASRMGIVQCEGVSGPIIAVANEQRICELEIEYFNFEQSIQWRNSFGYTTVASNDLQYYLKDRTAKISELEAVSSNETVVRRVPIFNLASSVIHILSCRISNLAVRWKNSKDIDPTQYICTSFIASKGTSNVNMHIDMLEAHDFAFFLVDSKANYTSYLTIDHWYSQLLLARGGNEASYSDVYGDGEAVIALPYFMLDPTSTSKFDIKVNNTSMPYLGAVNLIDRGMYFGGISLFDIIPMQTRYSLTATAATKSTDNGKEIVWIRNEVQRILPYPIRVEQPLLLTINMRLQISNTTNNGDYRVQIEYYKSLSDTTPTITDTLDINLTNSYKSNSIRIIPRNGANFVILRKISSEDTKTWANHLNIFEIKTSDLNLVSDVGTPLFYDVTDGKYLNSDGADMTNVTSVRGSNGAQTNLTSVLSSNNKGLRFFNTTYNKYAVWNGTDFVRDGNIPFDAPLVGITALRPTDVPDGYIYYDTSLDKFIIRRNATKITKYTFAAISGSITTLTLTIRSASNSRTNVSLTANDTLDSIKQKVINALHSTFASSKNVQIYLDGDDLYLYSTGYFKEITSSVTEGAYIPTRTTSEVTAAWVDITGTTVS